MVHPLINVFANPLVGCPPDLVLGKLGLSAAWGPLVPLLARNPVVISRLFGNCLGSHPDSHAAWRAVDAHVPSGLRDLVLQPQADLLAKLQAFGLWVQAVAIRRVIRRDVQQALASAVGAPLMARVYATPISLPAQLTRPLTTTQLLESPAESLVTEGAFAFASIALSLSPAWHRLLILRSPSALGSVMSQAVSLDNAEAQAALDQMTSLGNQPEYQPIDPRHDQRALP
jgi:hypothetical protein